MYYECQRCKYIEARGCMPDVSYGMYLMLLLSIAFAVLRGAVDRLFPLGLGWWWLLAGPLLVVASLPLSILLYHLLAALEWAAFCRRKCPRCGAQSWSWGQTRGFGL